MDYNLRQQRVVPTLGHDKICCRNFPDNTSCQKRAQEYLTFQTGVHFNSKRHTKHSRTSQMHFLALAMSVLFIVGLQPVSGRILTQDDISDIERFVEYVRKCHGIMAASLSVVQGDRNVIARGFGYSDVENQRNAHKDTPFCIGSLTKAFTTTLLAMQMAESKEGINWDTPLHCYPDSDIVFNDDIRSSQATMRDIVSHRLGVPGYFGILLVGYPENTTRHDIIQRIRFMTPTRTFRSTFQYNNFLYAMAGYGTELLSGNAASWEQLNKDRLFNPSGMAASGYIDKITEPPGLALPYVHVHKTAYRLDTETAKSVSPLGPAGSIYSTATDMGKWLQFHLAVISRVEGSPQRSSVIPFPGGMTVSPEAVRRIAETYQGQMPEPPFTQPLVRPRFPVDDVQLSYAMGWVRGIYRGYRKLFHTGGILSYISLAQLLPDVNAGIFLSTSGPGGRSGGTFNRLVAAYITDKIIGKPHWFNDTTACSFPAPWAKAIPDDYKNTEGTNEDRSDDEIEPITRVPKKPTPSLPTFAPKLDSDSLQGLSPSEVFPGRYGHYAFGEITIYAKSNKLYAIYGNFGRFYLEQTAVVGFYYGHYLDQLWYLSNKDEKTSTLRFQFTHVEYGKASNLILPIDPSIGSTFVRGRDTKAIPPFVRKYNGLYQCTVSSGTVLSLHVCSAIIVILTIIQTASLS